MEIAVGDYKINYSDIGKGQPILFLHGWGSSLEVWNLIIKHLEQIGKFRLVALDFPGCGKSSMPSVPLDLKDYTDLVCEFCNALNINEPIIMGHSHGGRVAVALAGYNLINIKKIVLFGAAALKPKAGIKKTLRIASFKTVKFFLTLPGIKSHSQSLLGKARAHYGSSDYNNAPEVMRKTLVTLVNTDLRSILNKVDCSVLLIWGSNDTAVPLYLAKEMEQKMPDAGLCMLEGCGHFALLERPAYVNIILDSFLK